MFDQDLTAEQETRHRLLENRKWLNMNIETLQKDYPDQWVAVLDGGVTANGPDVAKVKEAVAGKIEETVIMRIPAGAIPTPI